MHSAKDQLIKFRQYLLKETTERNKGYLTNTKICILFLHLTINQQINKIFD
ncbi:hypothetical protein TTHERM_000083509 (macronuclear) [Tetrahymena thermophila SB210]|uniref:Uncharacterized protein n=1 Tax=Tetrahymena thermophila (strain SB210) TaxID=312017 RepID=W7X790_TETTS|nr:hypothetical protein TTHERM_000083509 [Tetrahymena thermophila SB210]EWS75260.1 hypothetical protein TTHERM_000083509 [Tetrahymena thermophila SB210]|eukprot:XP_012652251.1 hypothetical protein TTHERM_000083509 [Tetrahymena thermophila SB210]